MNAPNKLDIGNFLRNMNNPDQDYAVIELQNIIKILEKYKEIIIPQNCDEFFLNNVLNSVTSKKMELIEAAFRAIVLLAQYFSIEKLYLIINEIISTSQQRECDIKPQLLSVFKEILANHIYYSTERNEKIFSILFPIVKKDIISQSEDNLGFSIELFTSLLDNLGSLAKPEELKETLDRIFIFLSPDASKDRQNQLRYIANLTKEWCKYAPQEEIDRLVKKLLSDEYNGSQTPHLILTVVALTNPKSLSGYIDEVFQLLHSATSTSNEEGEGDEDGDDIDDVSENENSSADIKKIQTSIEALAVLLQAIPEKMKKYTTELLDVFFNYISYEIVESDDQPQDEDNDDEIELDIEDGMEVSDDPMDDDEDNNIGFGEETWKYRKAASRLGKSLVHICPNEFVDAIVNGKAETIGLALKDDDAGAKKDILDLLALIIITFNNQINIEIINQWIQTISEQVKPADVSVIPLLSTIATISAKIPIQPSAIEVIFNNLLGGIVDTIAHQVILTSVAILRGACDSKEQAPIIAKVLQEIMNIGNGKFAAQAIDAADILYSHADISDEIINLNMSVIACYHQQGEKMIHAIPALSIFVSMFGMCETSEESLNVVVESVKNAATAKPAIAAMILICSYKKDIANGVAEKILPSLIQHSKSSDTTLSLRALWALYIFVKEEMVDIKPIAESAKEIFNASLESDMKTKSITLALFEIIARSIDIYDATVSIVFQKVVSNQFSNNALKNASAFLTTVAKHAETKMLDEIKQVFTKCNKEEILNESAAFCIGAVAASCKEIQAQFLDYIKKYIITQQPSPFALICAGQIFSSVPISSSDELITKITKFVSPEQPRAVFGAAAEAVGCIMAGNPTEILPIILKEAEEQEANFMIWLTTIESFTTKIMSLNIPCEKIEESLISTLNYLMKERDIKKEAEMMISKSFANIILVNNSLITRLLEVARGTSTLSPIAADAIDIFFKHTNEENVTKYLPEVIALAVPEKLSVASSALNCMKTALRYKPLISAVQGKLNDIIECSKFKEEHIVKIETGLEVIRNDVGKTMRCSAMDLLSTLYNITPEFIAPEVLINSAITAIEDPDTDVVVYGMALITNIGLEETTRDIVAQHAKEIASAFRVAHKDEDECIPQEIEKSMYKAVATMMYATRAVPCPELVHVRERYRESQLMAKAEEDVQSEISTRAAIKASDSMSHNIPETQLLLEKINSEAVDIYSTKSSA